MCGAALKPSSQPQMVAGRPQFLCFQVSRHELVIYFPWPSNCSSVGGKLENDQAPQHRAAAPRELRQAPSPQSQKRHQGGRLIFGLLRFGLLHLLLRLVLLPAPLSPIAKPPGPWSLCVRASHSNYVTCFIQLACSAAHLMPPTNGSIAISRTQA